MVKIKYSLKVNPDSNSITGVINKKALGFTAWEFKPEESDAVIKGLVDVIGAYEREHNRDITPESERTEFLDKRLVKVTVNGLNFSGTIVYERPVPRGEDKSPADISIELKFDPAKPKDKGQQILNLYDRIRAYQP